YVIRGMLLDLNAHDLRPSWSGRGLYRVHDLGIALDGQQQRAGLGVRRAPVLLSVRGFELSPRSRFGDDLLVEPSHGVDSQRGKIEVDRLYPELAHGAQVVDDLLAAGEQEPLAVVGLRGRRGSVAMDPKGERDACRIAADVGGQLAPALDRRPVTRHGVEPMLRIGADRIPTVADSCGG